MKATTLKDVSRAARPRPPLRRRAAACLAAALAALALFSARERVGVAGTPPGPPPPAAAQATPRPTPSPLPTPAWRQPTKPDTTYVCDWKRPGSSGMARLSFEYTRQTPGNGWLGKLSTTYRNGARRTDGTQFFAPKSAPRLGTEWRFQTTDGKITCSFAVSRLGTVVKFAGCNNGVEQYCVDERLIAAYENAPDAGCSECRGSGGVFDKMTCLARCLSRADSGSAFPACAGTPVQCSAFYMAKTFWATGSMEGFTRAGLSDLHQNWVDFVNGALGRCDANPHLCPFGTNCGSGGDCEMRCVDYGGGVTNDCPNGFKCGGRGTCVRSCTSSSTCPEGSVCGIGGTCEKRSN